MKLLKTTLLFVFLFLIVNLSAQYKVSLKSGATFEGNIESIKGGFFESEIRLDHNNKASYFKIEEIEKIEKDKILYQQFSSSDERLFFKKKNVLLQQIVDGKIKLWAYKYSYSYQQKQNADKKIAVRNIFYVQDQKGELIRLDQNVFLPKLQSILTGNKEVNEILQNRGYAYNQIPNIIRYYNKLMG